MILSWSQVAKFIRDNPSEIFDDYDNAPPSAPAVQAEAAVVSFDYSELDSDTAAKLESVTAEIFNVRKDYVFTMAKKVAYAHDLLANHYGGKFGAWCESIGISRDTGNNLVRVAEIFGNITSEEQKNLSQVKPSLLYEAAKPSAPAELVEQVMSGDITTHKEYIELKKELEVTEKQNAVLRSERDQAKRTNTQLSQDYKSALDRANKAARRVDGLESELNAMRLNIEELESRPRDVAVQSDPEDAKRIAELEEEIKNLRSKPNELDFGDDDGVSADKLSEFYEMLHGKVLAALKDCKAFVLSDDLPQIVKDRAVGRFGTLKDLITMYIEDMEE